VNQLKQLAPTTLGVTYVHIHFLPGRNDTPNAIKMRQSPNEKEPLITVAFAENNLSK